METLPVEDRKKPEPIKVREKVAALAPKLGRLQMSFVAVLPSECTGRLVYFGSS